MYEGDSGDINQKVTKSYVRRKQWNINQKVTKSYVRRKQRDINQKVTIFNDMNFHAF
jgi:hypothetical protein